jgi:hypothetical protein
MECRTASERLAPRGGPAAERGPGPLARETSVTSYSVTGVVRLYLRWNRSTRPAVSMSFCLPV